MADTEKPGTETGAKTSQDFEPGTVDENTHGWAPDAPGTGEAQQRASEAGKKAFEGNDTQPEATAAAADTGRETDR